MMAIKLIHAPQNHKHNAVVGTKGSKTNKIDDGTNEGSSGFSAMMTAMSASGSESDADTVLNAQDNIGSVAAIVPFSPLNPVPSSLDSAPVGPSGNSLAGDVGVSSNSRSVVALRTTGIEASTVNLNQPVLPGVQKDEKSSQIGSLIDEASATDQEQADGALAQFSEMGKKTKAMDKSLQASVPFDEKSALTQELSKNTKQGETAMPAVGMTSSHSNSLSTQMINLQAQDAKDTKLASMATNVGTAKDAISVLLPSGAAQILRPQERAGFKSGFGQPGTSGFEAAFGQTTLSLNRSDAVFVVPPASAAVADTAVAETVSYWVGHGVHSAQLTLDGFGESPVQVSILLNGDQAQIDFRTDQSGVRQVLEGAMAQLKELLSGQGLQLSGVSVGTSGHGGDAGAGHQTRQGMQRVTLVKDDALSPVAVGAKHPSVGRSLDLFV
jgi:flagellar hook-length control protein FliK